MRGILIAALVAMFVSLFVTPVAIKLLLQHRYGQEIKIRAPETHRGKQGTPTMGGTVILLAAILGYTAAKLVTWRGPSVSALLALGLATGLGLVGFADDFIKIRMQRNLGLRARTKLIGQVGVAVAFAVLALQFRNGAGFTPASTHISFVRDSGLALGAAGFVIWALLIVSATSNSVNLTDGLDGLAAGASAMVFGAMVAIIFSQARNNCAISNHVGCYEVRDPFDLAIVAAGFGGACVGFLWWNASPARIFMGDTGSLALGGAIAGLAILSRIELLLFVLCGLFVIITMSSVIQIVSFRYTGKRVFKMAPLQHHFEMKGWQEITIVIRFWIIAAIAVALALGIFYAERLTWTAT